MRVSTSITTDDLAAVPQLAAALEARGFDELQSQDGKHDPFLPLALAATTTERIGLATNVAISFPRSPMVAAVTSWDLQALSNGRFTLGLGSQIKPHNERRYSVPWSAPAPRMREYVQAMRAIYSCWTDGERLQFEGDHYTFTLMTPNFTPPPLEGAPPGIYLAAVGPNMLGVASRHGDGVNLHPFCTRAYLESSILPRIQAGLVEADVNRRDYSIVGGGFIATGADAQAVSESRERVRQRIGFYGSTPSYWPVLETHDMVDLGQKLNAMSKAGEWSEMTDAISDDVLDLFCAHGTHDEIGAEVGGHFGGLVDGVGLDSDTPGEVIEAIQAVPTGATAA